MAKLAASEAATAISHQVSIPGAWTPYLRGGLRWESRVRARCPSPRWSFCVADPAPAFHRRPFRSWVAWAM